MGPLPTRGGALAGGSCVWKAAANVLASETESLLKRKDGDFFEVGEEARRRWKVEGEGRTPPVQMQKEDPKQNSEAARQRSNRNPEFPT